MKAFLVLFIAVLLPALACAEDEIPPITRSVKYRNQEGAVNMTLSLNASGLAFNGTPRSGLTFNVAVGTDEAADFRNLLKRFGAAARLARARHAATFEEEMGSTRGADFRLKWTDILEIATLISSSVVLQEEDAWQMVGLLDEVPAMRAEWEEAKARRARKKAPSRP